jgi:hypothetical protein
MTTPAASAAYVEQPLAIISGIGYMDLRPSSQTLVPLSSAI